MKKILFIMVAILFGKQASFAVDDNTVEIVYNGTTASVTVANNISQYITVSSGNSSHVHIVQSEDFEGVDADEDNEDGEITYSLTGLSTNGEFYMEGSFKATVELNGLTLTNPSGPAIAIMNGKRIAVSAKKGTVNTLEDGVNEDYNGCFHCKGHTKMKGKGTINVNGKSKHALYSKEYLEIKNLTLNINSAVKDGIHCKEYFLLSSGVVSISNCGDDAIQVEMDGDAPTPATDTSHTDEDTGNFYMTGGTLTITDYQGSAVKTDGSATLSGGKCNFDTSDIQILAGVPSAVVSKSDMSDIAFDLCGRQTTVSGQKTKGLYLVKKDGKYRKFFIK